MLDGLYQSIVGFFIPFLAVAGTPYVSQNGLDVSERYRLGLYIAHPSVITINLYILINTYRWDWLTLTLIAVSILLIFFWIGVYTSFTGSATLYGAASEVYAQPSFWAVCVVTPIVSIMPRYFIKAIQKVYYPYDVDIIREQVALGYFKKLGGGDAEEGAGKASSSVSTESSNAKRHPKLDSVDEDLRPIYPPSVVTYSHAGHNAHSQSGSDGTNYTRHEQSTEIHRNEPPQDQNDLPLDRHVERSVRPSHDRIRPSYDRLRASMDLTRPSYEATGEFTSAAMLSRLESTRSHVPGENNQINQNNSDNNSNREGSGIVERIRRRTRGKSFKAKTPFTHKDNHIHEHE